MNDHCSHKNLAAEVMDQTLGIVCNDCDTCLDYCWGNNHIPESLWNRACVTDPSLNPRPKSRDNVCAICEDDITTKGDDE